MKFKIKDKVILGAFSGIIVTAFLNALDYLALLLNLNKWHIWQIAASLYFKQEDLTRFPVLLLGAFTHYTMVGFSGAILCYTLYFTGRTYYVIKGIGVLLLFWVALFGGILGCKITSISPPFDIPTTITHFIAHFIDGILTSYLIVKLADKEAWEKPIPTAICLDEEASGTRKEEATTKKSWWRRLFD